MKSILYCIIFIYTCSVTSISFAFTAKAYQHCNRIESSKNISFDSCAQIIEIEEDDLPEFEFKNYSTNQNASYKSFFLFQELNNHFLKRVRRQNDFLIKHAELFIFYQIFRI